VDGDRTTQITFSIDDAASHDAWDELSDQSVSVTNQDNDTAGFSLSRTAIAVSESGTADTFTVVLTARPLTEVVLDMHSGNTDEVIVGSTQLTFTPADWNIPQVVTVSGVDDTPAVADGDQVVTVTVSVNAAASNDAWGALTDQFVSVTNRDNDVAGFTLDPANGLVTWEAGGIATFTVRLTSQPTARVTIDLSSSDPTEGTVTPATLTFLPSAWDQPQTVTVTGMDDSLDDGDVDYIVVTAAAVSGDVNFNGVDPADVSVTNRDDDTAGVAILRGGGQTLVREGLFSDTYSINLTSQPTADVVIAVTPDSQLSVSPASLTFTAANWYVPQVVTVTAVDDRAAEGTHSGQIAHAATGADPTYVGTALPSLTAQINDNDTAGFAVSPAGGLVTSETGEQGSFTVRLTSQPTDDVTIGLSSNDLTEGTVLPASLTFTAGNWDVPQAVTIAGVNDDLHDGDQSYAIITAAAISADAGYHSLDAADVSVTNIDDDLGWHHRGHPYDVDGNGRVEAADVLKVINYINGHVGDPSLPPPPAAPPPYYDVNNDGLCTAADVLAVINYINTYGVGSSAEGESRAAMPAAALTGGTPAATAAGRRLQSVVQPSSVRPTGPPQPVSTRRALRTDAVFAAWPDAPWDELEDMLAPELQRLTL